MPFLAKKSVNRDVHNNCNENTQKKPEYSVNPGVMVVNLGNPDAAAGPIVTHAEKFDMHVMTSLTQPSNSIFPWDIQKGFVIESDKHICVNHAYLLANIINTYIKNMSDVCADSFYSDPSDVHLLLVLMIFNWTIVLYFFVRRAA